MNKLAKPLKLLHTTARNHKRYRVVQQQENGKPICVLQNLGGYCYDIKRRSYRYMNTWFNVCSSDTLNEMQDLITLNYPTMIRVKDWKYGTPYKA